MSGAEQQKNKEDAAAIMRAKQAAGKLRKALWLEQADSLQRMRRRLVSRRNEYKTERHVLGYQDPKHDFGCDF